MACNSYFLLIKLDDNMVKISYNIIEVVIKATENSANKTYE